MRKSLLIVMALGIGCSAKPGTPDNPTRLDSVLVTVDGVEKKIMLDSPDMVQDVSDLQGACVTSDLKRARLLRKGSECDEGWVSVKGNSVR